ncbi:hypothetical protein NQ314_010786 [Rhamnusium bicolor]|uniref:Diphthamide biosynthesis protein 4 n=1 Tax=Rhamnusium bicolor TaxID=1586634 RepID=A0AAV8XQB5_9CUCU|nr:hypothetical protein NQ314_010786 [Rhamnusium bicolor]
MDDGIPKNNGHQIKTEHNYYTILGCSERASLKELKQNYQDLIKKHHPDKQVGTSLSDQFILIDKAFKTLKDEKLRKEYDASLLESSFKEDYLIYAEISKNDLSFNDEGAAYFSCRCGDSFRIDQHFLEQECIIECAECTNCILIK